MEKKDLKNLMIVELKNENKYVVVEDLLIGVHEYFTLSYYEENLINKGNEEWDIIKVYDVCERWGLGFKETLEYEDNKLIWERPKELLTLEEKNYLKEILNDINYEVNSITKGNYYIGIRLGPNIMKLLPCKCMIFKFEGMETYKPYTLKELGLDWRINYVIK